MVTVTANLTLPPAGVRFVTIKSSQLVPLTVTSLQSETVRDGDEEVVTMTNDCNGDIGRTRAHDHVSIRMYAHARTTVTTYVVYTCPQIVTNSSIYREKSLFTTRPSRQPARLCNTDTESIPTGTPEALNHHPRNPI